MELSKESSLAPEDRYRGLRVLVTGASGFIGSSLVARLLSVDCTIDRLSRGKIDDLPCSGAVVRAVSGNMRDPFLWERLLPGVDVVFHLAAQTSSVFSDQDPTADLKANVLPILSLLTVCRDRGYNPAIVFAGTVTQAGLSESLPVDESQPDAPVTIYDFHKLTAERYLAFFSQSTGINGVTLRLPNIYGPGPESSRPDRGILNAMIRRALKGEAISLYKGYGQYRRDYLYVGDVVRAFLLAGIAGESIGGQHFVLGTGTGTTLHDAFTLVAELVGERTGCAVPLERVDPPSSLSLIETRDFIANPVAFGSSVGWESKVDLRTGINKTIEAFA